MIILYIHLHHLLFSLMQLALHLLYIFVPTYTMIFSTPHLARVGDGAHDIAAASEGYVRHLHGKRLGIFDHTPHPGHSQPTDMELFCFPTSPVCEALCKVPVRSEDNKRHILPFLPFFLCFFSSGSPRNPETFHANIGCLMGFLVMVV